MQEAAGGEAPGGRGAARSEAPPLTAAWRRPGRQELLQADGRVVADSVESAGHKGGVCRAGSTAVEQRAAKATAITRRSKRIIWTRLGLTVHTS